MTTRTKSSTLNQSEAARLGAMRLALDTCVRFGRTQIPGKHYPESWNPTEVVTE